MKNEQNAINELASSKAIYEAEVKKGFVGVINGVEISEEHYPSAHVYYNSVAHIVENLAQNGLNITKSLVRALLNDLDNIYFKDYFDLYEHFEGAIEFDSETPEFESDLGNRYTNSNTEISKVVLYKAVNELVNGGLTSKYLRLNIDENHIGINLESTKKEDGSIVIESKSHGINEVIVDKTDQGIAIATVNIVKTLNV